MSNVKPVPSLARITMSRSILESKCALGEMEYSEWMVNVEADGSDRTLCHTMMKSNIDGNRCFAVWRSMRAAANAIMIV
jgi:hypothetical protein